MKRLFFLSLILFSFFGGLLGQPASNINAPKWSFDKVIYEVNLRQFTESGTIKEFMQHLPRLKELGVGILWFMPIHPIGELNRKGTLGSYYSVKDYFDVDPNLGTKDDFRQLVSEIHKLGMYVIIDWVANHTSWDNGWTVSNPDFYKRDSLGNFVPPVPDWSDVIALDYNNKGLWQEMNRALEYWVRDFNIDGYRCDVAGMVPTPYWNQLRPKLEAIKPVFMLAEWEDPALHTDAFDMTYSWNLHHLMVEVIKGKANSIAITNLIEKELKDYPKNAFRMRFTTNHDENSWNGTEFEKFGDGAKPLAVLCTTLPGMLLIYSGQEAGNTDRLDFFEKDPIKWKESEFTPFYKSLTTLKKEYSPLHNGMQGGDFLSVKMITKKRDQVASFIRSRDNQKILVIANLTSETADISLTTREAFGTYTDYFTGEKLTVKKKNKLVLKGWEYKVLIAR
ncbi:MAG TPA: alpha-amylase family glycosyl hydrolase [Ignavibacteriaceae bacterium]|nr:alpha-amylase family glycosyl hydrolase [Ignavibacteriaceae bacterium]HOJ17568.1 alpha-amylase family glycosyl hydrolase [Ignavibacteriaceae bacterium]